MTSKQSYSYFVILLNFNISHGNKVKAGGMRQKIKIKTKTFDQIHLVFWMGLDGKFLSLSYLVLDEG